MLTALERDCLDTAYEDVEHLVTRTVADFIRRYGGDYNELRGEAHAMFMLAYNRFEPDRFQASFSTYVRWVVWKGLLELQRRTMRHKGKVSFTDADLDLHHASRDFNLLEFLDDLSDDAATLVRLVLDTPRGLACIIEREGATPQVYKSVLKEYLSGLGWTGKRVTESFKEIRKALR
jgi:hypothetical protein